MKLTFIVGTRPNFVKIAPLVSSASKFGITYNLIHTGQHYDTHLSDDIFRDLQLPPPEINLKISGGSPVSQIGRMLPALESILPKFSPDYIVVVGDTNSTVAGALAAKHLGLKLIHIEGGLRSGDWSMPEEINRVVTDSITDIFFVTESAAVNNLRKEGHTKNVYLVGNIMIDTLLKFRPEILRQPNPITEPKYALVTMHRPANVDQPEKLRAILAGLNRISQKIPLVFLVHPRTRAEMHKLKIKISPSLRLLPPLGYLQMQKVMQNSYFVITDSGGLQDETTWLHIPCLTIRPNTERPSTVSLGTSVLVHDTGKTLETQVDIVLSGKYKTGKIPPLWDGRSADRILKQLLKITL